MGRNVKNKKRPLAVKISFISLLFICIALCVSVCLSISLSLSVYTCEEVLGVL